MSVEWTGAGPTGTMAVTTLPDTPNGAGPDDILASDTRPVPVVLSARRRPRPPVRPEARTAVPRRRPGPGAPDRHHLDPGGQAQRPLPVLLHRRRGRRQEGRPHRPTTHDRSRHPVAQGGH